MSCHNCIGVDIAGLRKRLDEQLRENDRLLAVIGELTRGKRHEAAADTGSVDDDNYDAGLPDCQDGIHVGTCRHALGQRHEDAERAVGAHLRVDETPGAVPEKLQEE